MQGVSFRVVGSVASSADARWCVVRTKPGQETRAEQNLRRQRYSVFHPKRATTRRIRSGWKEKVVTLFPGYVFVYVDRAGISWAPINSTYGVQSLITVGGRPASVPHAFVEELRSRCAQEKLVTTADDLSIGQKVRFSTGPFTDLVGKIERLGPKDRVRLLVELMSGRISVETKRECLLS